MDSTGRSKQPFGHSFIGVSLQLLGLVAGLGAICGLAALRAELREQPRGVLEGKNELAVAQVMDADR
ncbi:MAG: hypothetical protein AB4040_11140 [Synechococcus sp.]